MRLRKRQRLHFGLNDPKRMDKIEIEYGRTARGKTDFTPNRVE